jgi:membrane-associated phospholipid phosphatase
MRMGGLMISQPMNDNTSFRNWLLTFAVTVIVVLVCMAYVDRPGAEFFDAHVRHTASWVWLDRSLRPLDAAVVLALLFLLVGGAWVVSGRSLGSWTRVPLLCSWAAMWAAAADIIFKRIFGHGAPDPTYLQDHLYGFHWLHGSSHWESFPSGTAAISSAIASVLWIAWPRSRAIGALIIVFLCVAVIVTNYHWVSDVVAGVFLGASIGWMTVHLQRTPQIQIT